MVHVVAEQYIAQKDMATYLELTNELISETRKEVGCIFYSLHRDENDESHLTFIEKWESRVHLEAHFESFHFKRIIPFLKELTEKNGNIAIYKDVF